MNNFKDKDLWDELGAYKARVEVAEVRAESVERDRDEWEKRFMGVVEVTAKQSSCYDCPWCPADPAECEDEESGIVSAVICKARILAHYGVEDAAEKPCIECQARPDLCHEHPKQEAADANH